MRRDGSVARLAAPGDAAALADAIQRVLDNRDASAAMGRAAHEWVCRTASCRGFADRMETVLRGLVSHKADKE
jgi:glycosyltransferase involved in cell wall biosynthesis